MCLSVDGENIRQMILYPVKTSAIKLLLSSPGGPCSTLLQALPQVPQGKPERETSDDQQEW